MDLSPTKMGFYGELTLAGGQSPEEMHAELVASLAPRTVASRWLNLDAHPWDYEFGGDDEDEIDEIDEDDEDDEDDSPEGRQEG